MKANNNAVDELEAVERKIEAWEQEINEVKAQVKVLEGKANRTEREEKELEQKREEKNLLLANLDKLRKEKNLLLKERQRSPNTAEELGSAMGRLSVNTRGESSIEAKQVTLVFQDFERRDKGASLTLSCLRGADFLEDARRMVQKGMSVLDPDMQICFCFYARGCEGRVKFNDSRAYWDFVPLTCIYYWCGEKPPSPIKKIAELEKRMDEEKKRTEEEKKRLDDEIQRLKLSSTAAARLEEFDKRQLWSLNDVERFLGSNELPALDAKGLSDSIKRVVMATSEPQSQWNKLFEFLRCSLFDTHSVNNAAVNLTDRDGTKHYPDFSFVVGPSVLWERLVWVVELKKDLTDAPWRDAVVQVFSRVLELLDHQPERVVVPAIVLDGTRVSFVRIERGVNRELQLFVSERLQLFKQVGTEWSFTEHGVLLRRFLGLSPSDCGYVKVEMPILLGKTMRSMLRPGLTTSVYIGEDGLVYKKGPRVAHEAEMLRRVGKLVPSVCPQVFECEGDVLCMAAGTDVRGVLSEVDVALLASQLFWHVYQVHECGLVHGDIKPGNVLRMCATPQQYVLCDWDSAACRSVGEDVTRRCTAGFCEAGPLNCVTPEDFDLLGVYWTVAYILAANVQGGPIGTSAWLRDQIKFMSPPPRAMPQIQWFLRDQIHNGMRLTHPRELVARFAFIPGTKSCDEWIVEVRKLEQKTGWPVCPERLLEQLWKKCSEGGGFNPGDA